MSHDIVRITMNKLPGGFQVMPEEPTPEMIASIAASILSGDPPEKLWRMLYMVAPNYAVGSTELSGTATGASRE